MHNQPTTTIQGQELAELKGTERIVKWIHPFTKSHLEEGPPS